MQITPLTSTQPIGRSALSAERLSRMSPAEQRHVVAQQFEAIILRQLLAPALQSMPGAGNGMYSYLLTDAFAQKLSAGGGMGLGGMLERQFTPRGETAATPHSATGATHVRTPSAPSP